MIKNMEIGLNKKISSRVLQVCKYEGSGRWRGASAVIFDGEGSCITVQPLTAPHPRNYQDIIIQRHQYSHFKSLSPSNCVVLSNAFWQNVCSKCGNIFVNSKTCEARVRPRKGWKRHRKDKNWVLVSKLVRGTDEKRLGPSATHIMVRIFVLSS